MSTMTIIRRIAATPEEVFALMSTPEGLKRWIGPDDGPVLVADADPRVGGAFHLKFRTLDGSEHESDGEFLEVESPNHLVMRWHWRDEADNSIVKIDLKRIADETDVHFRHEDLPDPHSADLHREGWDSALDKLVAAAEGK
jgi:uncharacterized protein YndB with AHSA1/START domain